MDRCIVCCKPDHSWANMINNCVVRVGGKFIEDGRLTFAEMMKVHAYRLARRVSDTSIHCWLRLLRLACRSCSPSSFARWVRVKLCRWHRICKDRSLVTFFAPDEELCSYLTASTCMLFSQKSYIPHDRPESPHRCRVTRRRQTCCHARRDIFRRCMKAMLVVHSGSMSDCSCAPGGFHLSCSTQHSSIEEDESAR